MVTLVSFTNSVSYQIQQPDNKKKPNPPKKPKAVKDRRGADLQKKSMNSAEFQFKDFFAKLVNISAKFGFLKLNVQIINYLKKINFILCKLFRIWKYYAIRMIISCSTCINEEKNTFFLNI